MAHLGPGSCSIWSQQFYETDASRGFVRGYNLQVTPTKLLWMEARTTTTSISLYEAPRAGGTIANVRLVSAATPGSYLIRSGDFVYWTEKRAAPNGKLRRYEFAHPTIDAMARFLADAPEPAPSAALADLHATLAGMATDLAELNELRALALVRGAQVVRGQAITGGGAALKEWGEVMRSLCITTEIGSLEARVLKSLVPDLPELLGRPIQDPPELDSNATMQRLFDTVLGILLRQSVPTVMILEDLHWSSPESLMLLRRLTREASSTALLVLASYRNDERADLPQQLPGSHYMQLERLSSTQVAELAHSMLGSLGRDDQVLAILEKESEGNTFFLIEVVRALAEQSGGLAAIGREKLPQAVQTGGIQAILSRRLERVPQRFQELLQQAAVVGRQIDLAVMRQLDADCDAFLQECANAAVLEVFEQQWRFSHDKLREALLSSLQSNGKARVLSSPSLVVLNNKEASINVGTQLPVVSSFVSGVTTTDPNTSVQPGVGQSYVQFRNTGITLKVTPRVNPGGLVFMEVSQEDSQPIAGTLIGGNVALSQRQVSTEIAVQSGQTVLLGGLIRETESVTKGGVPGLSKIPVIGALFGGQSKQAEREELLLVITPTVISNAATAQEITDDYRSRFQGLKPLLRDADAETRPLDPESQPIEE